jgi:peptidyl-prolyl cis-trans isomerase D
MQKEGATATDLPNATKEQIPSPDLAAAAFAAPLNAVSAPLQGPFGWQVFKVTAIQPGVVKSFDDVKPVLHARIVADKAADVIYDRSAKIEDLLTGGTPLDELPADFGLVALTGTLDAEGNTPEGKPAPIQADDALRAAILREAFQAKPETPPHLIEGPRNAEGSTWFALQVEQISPPAPKPLETVKDTVTADWIHDQRRHAQETEAARILSEVKAGKPLAEAAAGHTIATPPPAGRATGAPGLPVQLLEPLFVLKQGEPTMAETADGFAVAVLTTITEPDIAADPAEFGKLRDQLARSVGDDMQALLTLALRNRADPKINTAVFNTVAQSE